MSDNPKNWASTVMGWFVVRDGQPDDPAAAEPLDAPADAPAPLPVDPQAPLPEARGGQVDFDAVFSAYGIEPEGQERLRKAAELLRNLPEGTDPVVKRQIVEASLKAFGIPIDGIIEAGCEQIQALDAYARRGGDGLQSFSAEAEQRIAALEEEIRLVRRAIEEKVAEQRSVVTSCNARKLEVQKVLEFFGQEAVAKIVRESPKLVDPSQPH